MRIGVFSDSYTPYTSGVVTSIKTFKYELEKRGHEVFIFAPSYPHYHVEEKGIYRFYSLPSPTNPDFTLAIPVLPGLNMLVRRLNLDIIHVHSPVLMGRVGLRYAKKYRIPIVFTYHTMYDQYVHYIPLAQELAKDITIKYSNSFCNSCDHVIVPTPEVAEILKNYHIKTPVTVLPTGVPLQKFDGGVNEKDWLRRNYSIPENNKILLFVGRLAKEKNLEFLIKAFKKLKDSRPDTTLVLTAQGPIEADLKKLVKKLNMSLEDDVVFTGALPFDTLVKAYYSADLFVFSSLTETQGLVLIEAMAAGLPVVAVKASGVQDMVDHNINGILTAEDIDEFSQAVLTVLQDDELYARLKENAFKKAYLMSSEAMTTRLENIYNELCENYVGKRSRHLDFYRWFGA